MDFLELKYNDKIYTSKKEILNILKSEKLYWLIDSECEEAVVEIIKNTVIWHSGIFLTGNWKYGIFKNGEFYGIWENGIWENGIFNGDWKSGIKNNSPL